MKTLNFKTLLARYWRIVPALCLLLGLLAVLFVITGKQSPEQCSCHVQFKFQKEQCQCSCSETCLEAETSRFQDAKENVAFRLENITWKMEASPDFTVAESVMGPLPIPYKYLLGYPSTKKKFLTVGISTVQREREQYLLRTLESIYSHCKPEELKLITVVIYLANNDSTLNVHSAREIEAHFGLNVKEGQLLVIESSLAGYPPLTGMGGTLLESQQEAVYRSKQNVDYAYLFNFCANLSSYYLMLEDDIVCANNFVSIIQNYVRNTEESWTTVAFSSLGYIGKLYHSSDLFKLARFLLMFYDQMAGDWLLDLFLKAQTQTALIIYKPSLFQHIGRVSLFHNKEIHVQDPEFQEDTGDFGDFPTALCFTNIPVFADYIPSKVCPPEKGLFWGINITPESFFTIVFENPVVPQKIQICTGSAEYNQDILHYGYVETGRVKIQTHDSQTCLIFKRLGDFNKGLFEMKNSSSMDEVDCLRIQAAAPQKQWLQIRRISIWVKNS